MTLTKREQDKLVVDNLGATYRFATVFWKSNRDLELDDCKSEAMFASIMAAQKFDPAIGKQFSTLLFLVIKRRLLNLARDTRTRRRNVGVDTEAVERAIFDEDDAESRCDEARFQERLNDRAPNLNRFLMGHSFADIGRAEGVNRSTVYRRAVKETKDLNELMGTDATLDLGDVNNLETLGVSRCRSTTPNSSLLLPDTIAAE